mgnify:CR=1 FL=1
MHRQWLVKYINFVKYYNLSKNPGVGSRLLLERKNDPSSHDLKRSANRKYSYADLDIAMHYYLLVNKEYRTTC